MEQEEPTPPTFYLLDDSPIMFLTKQCAVATILARPVRESYTISEVGTFFPDEAKFVATFRLKGYLHMKARITGVGKPNYAKPTRSRLIFRSTLLAWIKGMRFRTLEEVVAYIESVSDEEIDALFNQPALPRDIAGLVFNKIQTENLENFLKSCHLSKEKLESCASNKSDDAFRPFLDKFLFKQSDYYNIDDQRNIVSSKVPNFNSFLSVDETSGNPTDAKDDLINMSFVNSAMWLVAKMFRPEMDLSELEKTIYIGMVDHPPKSRVIYIDRYFIDQESLGGNIHADDPRVASLFNTCVQTGVLDPAIPLKMTISILSDLDMSNLFALLAMSLKLSLENYVSGAGGSLTIRYNDTEGRYMFLTAGKIFWESFPTGNIVGETLREAFADLFNETDNFDKTTLSFGHCLTAFPAPQSRDIVREKYAFLPDVTVPIASKICHALSRADKLPIFTHYVGSDRAAVERLDIRRNEAQPNYAPTSVEGIVGFDGLRWSLIDLNTGELFSQEQRIRDIYRRYVSAIKQGYDPKNLDVCVISRGYGKDHDQIVFFEGTNDMNVDINHIGRVNELSDKQIATFIYGFRDEKQLV